MGVSSLRIALTITTSFLGIEHKASAYDAEQIPRGGRFAFRFMLCEALKSEA